MKRFLTVLTLLFGVCGAVASSASGSSQSIIDTRAAGMPGSAIVAAVIDRGRVITYFAGSSGTGRKLDSHTLFEIGSVTKTFTATALASLVRAHRVGLSDPVARYLPLSVHVPSLDGKTITLLNLATQHSGLPRLPANMGDVSGDNPYLTYNVADLYAFLNAYKLPRDPGATFEYSNLGFGLLGLALTHAAHERSYAALIQDAVFAPLHMNQSEVALSTAPDVRMAAGHNVDGDKVHSWEFTEADAGAGAIRSDLDDMIKYLRCNMGSGTLGAACLFAQQPRDTFTAHRIGLAWWTDDGSGDIEHGGDTAGFHAMIVMNRSRTKGVVVLSSGPIVRDIAMHLLDPATPVASPAAHVALSPTLLEQYAGTYKNTGAGIVYTISPHGDRLEARIEGQQPATIYPSRWPDHFYYKVVPAYIEFVRDSGSVVGLILTQDGQHVACYKIGEDGKPMATSLAPSYPPVVTLDASTLQQYAGTYDLGGAPVTVTVKDATVFAQLAGQPAYEIYPSAKDEFYLKIVDAQISFTRTNGAVTGLVLHQNGRDSTARRTMHP